MKRFLVVTFIITNLLTSHVFAGYNYIEINNHLISCSSMNKTTYCPAIQLFKELGYDSYYSYNTKLFVIGKNNSELFTIEPSTATVTNLVTGETYNLDRKIFVSDYTVYVPVEDIIHDFAQSDVTYVNSLQLSYTKRRL